MKFEIELEKLTDEQLEALRKINKSVVETEVKRRKESTYSDEDMANNKIYADLYKAYFFLKPLYDNMRNTDVKKTITQSEILPVLEKVFRWADSHDKFYVKYSGELVEGPDAAPEPVENLTPLEQAIEETKTESVEEPVVAPEPVEVEEPVVPTTPTSIPTSSAPVSPVEVMSAEELNKILANLPTVEKI